MDIRKLEISLQKDQPAAVYLIAGEEDALVDRALALVCSKALGKGHPNDFSVTHFDGKTTGAAEIEGAARTVSLFGERRLVVVKEAQDLRPEEQKRLQAYLEHPVAATTLVLVVRGGGAESRDPKRAKAAKTARTFSQALQIGGGVVVDCPRPKAKDMPILAEQLLGQRELRADSGALHALSDAVGEDLGALIQAVEKLALFKAGSGEVTRADIAEVVVDTREESVFALTDAVAEGATDRALGLLRRLQHEGESALAVLGHLVRHFRNLARVKALSKRGGSPEELHSSLGLHPFVVKKCRAQAGRFTEAALARRLKHLAEVDQRLKRSRLPDDLEMEKLVLWLCERG